MQSRYRQDTESFNFLNQWQKFREKDNNVCIIYPNVHYTIVKIKTNACTYLCLQMYLELIYD